MGKYGDDSDAAGNEGPRRPHKVKEPSEKRKRAMLSQGTGNPVDELRAQLAYDAQMEAYKKAKEGAAGGEDDDDDHEEFVNYGMVDVRRKKFGEEDIKEMTEEETEALNSKLKEESEEKERVSAEVALHIKEQQLVMMRLGDMVEPKRPGLVRRVSRGRKRRFCWVCWELFLVLLSSSYFPCPLLSAATPSPANLPLPRPLRPPASSGKPPAPTTFDTRSPRR